jgi:zinc transporter 9
VLARTLSEENKRRAPGVSLYSHLKTVRNPFTLAIILEDTAACTGVLVASSGIALTQLTGLMAFDTVACLSVGGLLAMVGARLALSNRQYLIGAGVDDFIISVSALPPPRACRRG